MMKRNMMKRNVMIVLCGVIMLCALSGCQLAVESAGAYGDKGANGYEDRLIGIFVTTEHLDLFDFESYFDDNISKFSGGEINMDGHTQKYQGRLYAALTTRELVDEETGERTTMREYSFKDTEGILYCVPTMRAEDEENSYLAPASDAAISDGHVGISSGDDESSISLEGTIFISPSSMNRIYYFNPVYQSADSSVYTVSGESFMFNSEAYGEGTVFSQTLDAVTTVTENGKAKTESASVKITISVMYRPELVVIVQMNADNRLLARAEYLPDELPEAFILEADTAYFIAETQKKDGSGGAVVSREIYGCDASNIETFYARADGVCVKRCTTIAVK